MTANALLVATATQWHGAARMARSLAEAAMLDGSRCSGFTAWEFGFG